MKLSNNAIKVLDGVLERTVQLYKMAKTGNDGALEVICNRLSDTLCDDICNTDNMENCRIETGSTDMLNCMLNTIRELK